MRHKPLPMHSSGKDFLTTLNETEITKVLKSSGISKENLALLLLEIKNATEYNNKNATEYNNKTTQSILNIQNGVGALMAIVKKLLL